MVGLILEVAQTSLGTWHHHYHRHYHHHHHHHHHLDTFLDWLELRDELGDLLADLLGLHVTRLHRSVHHHSLHLLSTDQLALAQQIKIVKVWCLHKQ